MFWNTGGKNQQALPYNKFNFIVNFSGLNEKLIELETDDKVLSFFAKKVSAPNMKVEFERAYANEYVHYFQNGAIHWEPITITFADFGITSGENSTGNDVNNNQEVSDLESQLDISSKLSIREIFNYYLQKNLIDKFSDPSEIATSELSKNVTGVIDLPIFCNFIQVKNNIRFANKDFSTKNNKSVLNREIVYEFYNPRITSVDFGSFEYGSDDINEISVTFVPQWVVIK
jgi:hypothetical protein